MTGSWEESTRAQYDDAANLVARQAIFAHLVDATPLAAPLDDLSQLAGQRVLDVGCGNGTFLTSAAMGGARAVGLDRSRAMVTAAAARSGAPVVRGDALALPVADGSVDALLALWMLYHVVDKPAALGEFGRALAADGVLVAATNSSLSSDLDRLVCDALAEVVDRPVDGWHAPLDFTAENGEAILGASFDDVSSHPFSNRFAVTDAGALVRYVGSMLGPIHDEHGPFDDEALLTAVGRRCELGIGREGSVRIERAGAVFLARSATR